MSHNKAKKNNEKTVNSEPRQLRAVDEDVMARVMMEDPDLLERVSRRLPLELKRVIVSKMTMYSGPLPDPDTMLRYKQVQDDAADRIIKMAEKEQAHRHSTDHKRLDNDRKAKALGQILGIASVVMVLALSAWLGYCGHPASAATVATGVTASLAAVFVFGQKYKTKQMSLQSKDEPDE